MTLFNLSSKNKQVSIIYIISKRFYPRQLQLLSPTTIAHGLNHFGLGRVSIVCANNLNPNINITVLPLTRVLNSRTNLCYSPITRPRIFIAPSIRNILNERFMSTSSFDDSLEELLGKKFLKTLSNKSYQTTLTEKTTVNDISDKNLIEEMLKRELIKIDNGNTTVTVKLEDDSNYLLGISKQGVKLSGLGQAYYEKLKDDITLSSNVIPELSSNFIIIVPPENSSKLFIETGKQKHLLVVSDNKGNYYAIGYMTSKNSGEFLSKEQFKKFQDVKEGNSNNSNKEQHIVFFDKCIKIEESSMKQVKWGKNYIENLSDDSTKVLTNHCEKLENKPYEIYNPEGITKEKCLQMCIEHDKIASSSGKKKHPLSADQVKQNKENEDKQKLKPKPKLSND